MSKQKNSLTKLPEKDVFEVIYSWPFHLLDSVKSMGIRDQANVIQFATTQLVSGKTVPTYSLSPALDALNEILIWIETYQHAKITLEKMEYVKKELQGMLSVIQNIYRETAIQEQNSIYNPEPKSNDEELYS